MRFIRRNKYIIISTAITLLFLLVFMVVKGLEPFGNSTMVRYDCQSQVYPLLCTLHDKLCNGESFLYSWEAGLGDGFLPTYFYYLSSPFNLLVVFVKKNDIRSFIHVMIFLKMTLSAMMMAIYLTYKEKEEANDSIFIVPISCAYAMSSFVFGFYHESMWLDSYMILPLVMLGYDRMLKRNKPAVYILSLVYSSLCSFYMTFIIGFFLVLWFLLDEHESLKVFAKKLILFGVSSLLAIGMTAFSILVSYIGVMKTHVEDEPEIVHKWFGNLFNILKYQFPFSNPINVSYDNNCANIYCGLFAVVLVFIYAFSDKIKVSIRIKRIIFLVFILLSMNEAILNFVWHGFHYQLCIPNRFAFVYIFAILLTAYEALECECGVKRTAIGLVIAEIYPMVSYFFEEFDSGFSSKVVLLISLSLVILYGALIILRSVIKKTVVYIALSVIMLAELLANAAVSISFNLNQAGRYDKVFEDSEQLISQIEASDNTKFYRAKLLGTVQNNTGNILGINGVQSFNSMMNNNMLRFADMFGFFRTDVSMDENGGYVPIDDILGIKYLYSAAEVFPEKMGYELVGSSDTVEVYRNNNALSLGYAVQNDIKEFMPKEHEVINNINVMATNMTGCGNIWEEVIPELNVVGNGYSVDRENIDYFLSKLTPNEVVDQPYVSLSFNVPQAGIYNMYIDYPDYGIFTIYVNDEIRRYEFTSFGGVLNLGKLAEGDKVDIFVQSENNMADGYSVDSQLYLELRFLRINEAEYNNFIETIKNNEMNIDELSGGHIIANVNSKDNTTLFTSIPYDESWHIYENGKELKTEKLVNTFLGVELSKGDHSLEFRYIPGGLYPGIVITIISWIIFFIWQFYCHIKSIGTESKK